MKNDHAIHMALMIGLIFFELLMLILSLFSVNAESDMQIENSYRFLYIFLILMSLISLILTNYFYKKNKTFQYYIFIAIFMFSVMLWGVGVSILMSFNAFSIMYYALAMIACSALICIEPWVSFLSVFLSQIAYLCLYYGLEGVVRTDPTSLYLGIIIAVLLVCLSFYFNFHRRVEALDLQIVIGELNEELEAQAKMDDLTKAYNRSFLTENIDKPLTYGDTPSAVMMVDVDHFKQINDTYGHQFGDQCLRETGRIILDFINNEDSYLIRYGGDEFLVFFNSMDPKKVVDIAEKMRSKVEDNTVQIRGGISSSFTISIGIAFAHSKVSYNSLINEADEALYVAKEKRNTVAKH